MSASIFVSISCTWIYLTSCQILVIITICLRHILWTLNYLLSLFLACQINKIEVLLTCSKCFYLSATQPEFPFHSKEEQKIKQKLWFLSFKYNLSAIQIIDSNIPNSCYKGNIMLTHVKSINPVSEKVSYKLNKLSFAQHLAPSAVLFTDMFVQKP